MRLSYTYKLCCLLALVWLAACNDGKPKPIRYTITFDSDGGTAIKPITVPRGGFIARPENPTQKGYVFDGWYAEASRNVLFNFESTPITFHLTLYAKWTEAASQSSYTVDFRLNSGEAGAPGNTEPQRVARGQLATAPSPAPTRQGHAFGGWYANVDLSGDSFNFDTPIEDNQILYAKWNAVSPRSEARLTVFNVANGFNTFTTLYDDERALKGVIDDAAGTVTVEPTPYLHDWSATNLVPSFGLSEGATARVGGVEQEPSVTAHDFSGPVTYEITSADGSTKKSYTVTVKPQSGLAHIPDAKFLAYLKATMPGAFPGNGNLLDTKSAEVTSLTEINVEHRGGEKDDVSSLKGLEFFTQLARLECGFNGERLTELNVSRNQELTHLNCSGNSLSRLDVSQNTKLTELLCFSNKLTELDITLNTELRWLNFANNELSKLNVSQNTKLARLECFNNRLEKLELDLNTNLDSLYCYYNTPLTQIDLRGMQQAAQLFFTDPDAHDGFPPALAMLWVHENLQNHEAVKVAKQIRKADITISTYVSSLSSQDGYRQQCADYDPTADNNKGVCVKTTP